VRPHDGFDDLPLGVAEIEKSADHVPVEEVPRLYGSVIHGAVTLCVLYKTCILRRIEEFLPVHQVVRIIETVGKEIS
jgi:hypothetical protein